MFPKSANTRRGVRFSNWTVPSWPKSKNYFLTLDFFRLVFQNWPVKSTKGKWEETPSALTFAQV